MVSIIIPSYNRETLIQDTLNSIIAQTYQQWEALVIDDNSTDSTCEVVQHFSDNDLRIKLIKRKREPKGGSVCRNIGIENAKGEYLIFLDSDDVLAPHCLENRVYYMDQNPDIHFAVFQMGVLSHDGVSRNEKLIKKKENYLYAFLQHDLPWTITGPIWKTDFMKNEIVGYNENYPRLQDPELNTRVLLKNEVKFHVLEDSEPDCYYRAHSDKVFNMSILLTGFELYIHEFYYEIKKRTDFEQCVNQLKFCYIEAIKGFYAYNKNNFTKEDIIQLKRITDFSFKNSIISSKTNILSSVLILLYKLKINKIPFGKYLLRFVMKMIKKS